MLACELASDEGYAPSLFTAGAGALNASTMIEFYAAVTRKDLKGSSAPGWHPEQAVSREPALKIFTIWAPHAAFAEKRGSILRAKTLTTF